MVGATNLMTKKLLSLHPYIHDANVTYYDGKKCHYVKIERLKQWCEDATQSTGKIYKHLYVKQEEWDSLGITPNSFEEIIPVFKDKKN